MSSSSSSRIIKKSRLSSASRCLFGRPSKEETESWLSSVSQMIRRRDESKWGFSFEREMPLPSSSSPYSYQMVDASSVPSFYRLTRYESSSSLSSSSSSPMEEDRMDISMESLHESSSDESFSSTSSDPPVTPRKSCKKRQAKITSFYMHRRSIGSISKTSTPSSSSSSLPIPSAIQPI